MATPRARLKEHPEGEGSTLMATPGDTAKSGKERRRVKWRTLWEGCPLSQNGSPTIGDLSKGFEKQKGSGGRDPP